MTGVIPDSEDNENDMKLIECMTKEVCIQILMFINYWLVQVKSLLGYVKVDILYI